MHGQHRPIASMRGFADLVIKFFIDVANVNQESGPSSACRGRSLLSQLPVTLAVLLSTKQRYNCALWVQDPTSSRREWRKMYFLSLSAEGASGGNAFYISGVPREVQTHKPTTCSSCLCDGVLCWQTGRELLTNATMWTLTVMPCIDFHLVMMCTFVIALTLFSLLRICRLNFWVKRISIVYYLLSTRGGLQLYGPLQLQWEKKKKSQVPVPKPLARRIKHDRERQANPGKMGSKSNNIWQMTHR